MVVIYTGSCLLSHVNTLFRISSSKPNLPLIVFIFDFSKYTAIGFIVCRNYLFILFLVDQFLNKILFAF